MTLRVELVSTGSELLNGRTVNQHAAVLGRFLSALGLELMRDTTVPDHLATIIEAVSGALERANLVFVSGGLGPTEDDVTREAMATLLRRRVVSDPHATALLQERLRAAGRSSTPTVERQALVVEGAVVLSNPVGFAPAERLDLEGKTLFLLPGPPAEFQAILETQIVPWLRAHVPAELHRPSHVFMICGLGESGIMERFAAAGLNLSHLRVAYCAAPGRVEVRISAENPSELDDAVHSVRKALGNYIFAEDETRMETVVGRLLKERNATVAVAESCSGGMLGARITAQSGSSHYFRGGVIAYADEVKRQVLGVSQKILDQNGAVSDAVARAMAENVRRLLGATYGIAVTGIAGPTGGTPEKPVGLVFTAVAGPDGTTSRSFRFSGGRDRIREWSVQMALDGLRRRLLGVGYD